MKKSIFAGITAFIMALSPVIGEAADINITIDGEKFIPTNAAGEEVLPFIEDGTTYLPVRAMGTAVGKAIEFDPENYAVYIGERPSDEVLKNTPMYMVGDSIYYADDIAVGGDMSSDYIARVYYAYEQIGKTVSATEDELASVTLAMLLMFPEDVRAEYSEACVRQARLMAGVSLAQRSIEMPETEKTRYVTVKHILVATAEDAAKVYEELDAGADFDELITKYNTDPGQTADSSYTFTYGEMVSEFEEAAFALGVDEITSEAVKSDYGYHIIKRLATNEAEAVEAYRSAAIIDMISEAENAAPEAIDLNYSSDIVAEIEDTPVTNEAVKEFGYNAETAIDAFASAVSLYNYLVENGLIEEAEIEWLKPSGTGDASADLDAYDAFLTLVNYMLEDECLDYDAVLENYTSDNVSVTTYPDAHIYIDGEFLAPKDVNGIYAAPKNADGTIYVPVRAIVEALGMSASWDNDTRTVVIESRQEN